MLVYGGFKNESLWTAKYSLQVSLQRRALPECAHGIPLPGEFKSAAALHEEKRAPGIVSSGLMCVGLQKELPSDEGYSEARPLSWPERS